MQKITIGRIVGLVLPLTHLRAGQVAPAVVTVVSENSDTVQLTPFLDVARDAPIEANACSAVRYDENKSLRTWHWLPRD